MHRGTKMSQCQTLLLVCLLVCGVEAEVAAGTSVTGVVRMPDVCSPAISPAVVYLAPAGSDSNRTVQHAPSQSSRAASAGVVLVNQRELQFVPRVQTIALGQTVQFTNQDGETHNVHVVSPGFAFNQSMAPGQFQEFTPAKPGVMRLACDIHMHMRGFVIVSPTRWVQVCDREGRYRLDDVSEGRYILTAWHEMGDPVRTEITCRRTMPRAWLCRQSCLPVLLAPRRGAVRSADSCAKPWADVIDRISVTLAASRDAATRPGELAKARRLADDAYWVEFESSDMETAVANTWASSVLASSSGSFMRSAWRSRDVARERQPRRDHGAICATRCSSTCSRSRPRSTPRE